jgi:hypothetical protein
MGSHKKAKKNRAIQKKKAELEFSPCPLDGSACSYLNECSVRLNPVPDKFECWRETFLRKHDVVYIERLS